MMEKRHTRIPTALGELTLVADGDNLTGIYYPRHWYLPAPASLGDVVEAGADELFVRVGAQLNEYLAGTRRAFDLPTAAEGDSFQREVWALLREIPYGQTTTYGELAVRLGNRSLAQSVGQAVGHNPLSMVVPCHRVLGKDGKLTGYAGGLERKRFLLELEEPAETKAGRLF
jgi:methylated-DNA-[protein]-cysteine S-methyltransferase